jgi:hypothetical protein
MSDDLMKRLCSLYKQATVERSHFYVGSCAKDAMHRIEELEAESKTLRSMVAGVIADTGDDPEIMAASRAEWASRALEAEAKLAKAVAELEDMQKVPRSDASHGILMVMIKHTLAELKGQE